MSEKKNTKNKTVDKEKKKKKTENRKQKKIENGMLQNCVFFFILYKSFL